MSSTSVEAPRLTIVYDGDCPFCSSFVRLARIRESAGPVRLVDAREGGPEVAALSAAGYDLNEGMIVRVDGRTYHGASAVHVLALLSTRNGLFNAMLAAIFGRPAAAALLYPALRAGRNLTLRALRRTRSMDSDS